MVAVSAGAVDLPELRAGGSRPCSRGNSGGSRPCSRGEATNLGVNTGLDAAIEILRARQAVYSNWAETEICPDELKKERKASKSLSSLERLRETVHNAHSPSTPPANPEASIMSNDSDYAIASPALPSSTEAQQKAVARSASGVLRRRQSMPSIGENKSWRAWQRSFENDRRDAMGKQTESPTSSAGFKRAGSQAGENNVVPMTPPKHDKLVRRRLANQTSGRSTTLPSTNVSRRASCPEFDVCQEVEQSQEDRTTHVRSLRPGSKFSSRPRAFSRAMLAFDLKLPFGPLNQACDIFERYSNFHQVPDMFEARLQMDDFVKVLLLLVHQTNKDCLPSGFVEEAYIAADRDRSGDIDIEEFAIWYSSFSFTEEIMLNKETRQFREVARVLGISLVDLERYKLAFDTYDVDGSGGIDKEEFGNMLNILLKIPKGHTLPDERVMTLWREADVKNEGVLSFEQFCIYYKKTFDSGYDTFQLPDFYRNIRRVPSGLRSTRERK